MTAELDVAPAPTTDRGHLAVRDLSVRFRLRSGTVAALSGVSLDLAAGQCLALVGESGCGKSVMISALLGLLPGNADTSGSALLRTGGDDQLDLLTASEQVLSRRVRGRQVGLVPQSPAAHLTPVRTGGDQLREVLRVLRPDAPDVDALAVATAARVGLPARALEMYPHELSGGMTQRVVTALALAGDAWLLLADEPTTGLDRALVDRTLDELRGLVDAGCAVLLVTHDLSAATRVADAIAVMYGGRIVEVGPTAEVLDHPHHPYTRGLVGALPDRGFTPIPGMPPELGALPTGCAFAPRCSRADYACTEHPVLRPAPDAAADRLTACHHPC